LPALLPATIHSSRTRFRGGARPPATVRKIAISSAVIFRQNAAFSTTRHVFQVPPLNQAGNSLSMASITLKFSCSTNLRNFGWCFALMPHP